MDISSQMGDALPPKGGEMDLKPELKDNEQIHDGPWAKLGLQIALKDLRIDWTFLKWKKKKKKLKKESVMECTL